MTPTLAYRIWIAGDYADAVRAVREWCSEHGDCYAVLPCDYVFSGGMESGVCVSRINYGRFPEEPADLQARVEGLADHLANRLFQKSYSIEAPEQTTYIKREGVWS